MKVACTVWSEGKLGDYLKELPITIIEIDENSVEHVVYHCELVIKHPEYEKLKKSIAAQSSGRFLPD